MRKHAKLLVFFFCFSLFVHGLFHVCGDASLQIFWQVSAGLRHSETFKNFDLKNYALVDVEVKPPI